MTTLATAALSAQQKRELLAAALRSRARAQTVTAPLSYGQKALWFLYRSAPDSAAYHVSFSARIRSAVDVAALRRALQALLERHAALRATFRWHEGEPIQEIAGQREIAFTVHHCPHADEQQLAQQVAQAYRRPFDLERGPVFRAELFSCAADDHVLLIVVHHIVYDAWSLWLNLDEIRQLYAAEAGGAAATLAPPRASYRDHIQRQQQMLEGAEGERSWNFWRTELAGELPMVSLPTDFPRPPVQTYNGASQRFEISPELSAQVRKLAQSEGVTPFMLLLAAYQVLLHRYSGQNDILVGSPTTGRGNPLFADVAGYFVNLVVLRANLEGNPPFKELLQRVAKSTVQALEHQDFPLPLLVERLQPRRDPSHAPLFQVSFVYQKPQRSAGSLDWMSWSGNAGSRLDFGGLQIEFFDQPQQEGQFDLELEVLDASDALRAAFKYNTDLYRPETMAQLARSFTVLLADIVARPQLPIRSLALLDAEQSRSYLQRAPRRPSSRPAESCLHHGFEDQARAHPHAIAITDGGRDYSYLQLNQTANSLAHYLLERGVGPEVRVGICLERSWWVVVAMLATLKAGGAYVPVAAEAPKERNAFILGDSEVAVLLTQASLQADYADATAQVVCIDTQWEAIQRYPHSNPGLDADIDSLLYVIYTSGSTGKPKGAQITHFNAARLFTATDDWFGFGPQDVWTLFHSFAFDFSVWEMWGALLYGGRLVIVPYAVSRSPEAFIELLNQQAVTVLNQTPSAFRQLMAAEERQPLRESSPLRYVVFGGEALDLSMLERWYARHDETQPRLVNMYGITETTVHVTYRALSRADARRGKSVIGEPIPDLQLYVLDELLRPVPIGVPGEMYVAGDGLCRGYLKRRELTAERFIEREVGPGTVRLYRTGDLARRLIDGDVEYLGRSDDQVKIRGFRIELGEIEAALAQCPQLDACVVVVREEQGDKRLVAYATARHQAALSALELREFLLQRLPDYMVPTCVILEALPLNSNGKIDRAALPAPQLMRAESGRNFVPPRDALEQLLTQHWESVLAVGSIGVRDNFFELGGHSLLAVNLMTRLEQQFKRKLPMALLFSKPTVEQLATALRDPAQLPAASPLVKIQPRGPATPFFCVAGGGGSVLYYYPLANQMAADCREPSQQRPFIGLQGIGLDGECEPLRRVEDLAQVYVTAIRDVQPQGPYLLGGHCFGGLVAFEISQQLRRQGEQVALLALMDVPACYPDSDPTAPPLDDTFWLAKLAEVIKESAGTDLGVSEPVLRQLDFPAQLELVNQRLQAVGFLPPGADVNKVRGLLSVFAANGSARYQPHDVQRVPITLLRAEEFHADYDYSFADDADCPIEHSTLGWQQYAAGEVVVHRVPGNHITMMSESNVAPLAALLVKQLRAAEQGSLDECAAEAQLQRAPQPAFGAASFA